MSRSTSRSPTLGEAERGEAVLQVVEPDGRQAGRANEPSEALTHGVWVKGLPIRATQEQLVVLVRLAQRQPLLELTTPVLLDDLDRL